MEDSHDRYITVGKDSDVFNCYYESTMQPDRIVVYPIHEADLDALYDSGFLDAVNNRYDLMLGDFEGGVISENLDFVLSEAEKIKDSCPKLYEAAKAAVEYGTSINFEL